MLAERVAQWAEEIRRKSAEEAEKKLQLVQKEAEIQLKTAKRDAKINLLTKLLKLKFGTLPSKYHGMIGTAGLKRIEKWAENILTADTLEDVFEA